MESFILCDVCGQEFNHYDRVAKLFPMCGHSICQQCCIAQLETTGPQRCQCPQCGLQHDGVSYESLPTNDKLMKIVLQLRGQPEAPQTPQQRPPLVDMFNPAATPSQNNMAM